MAARVLDSGRKPGQAEVPRDTSRPEVSPWRGQLSSDFGQLVRDWASLLASIELHKLLPIKLWPAWQLGITLSGGENPGSPLSRMAYRTCLNSLSGYVHLFPHPSTEAYRQFRVFIGSPSSSSRPQTDSSLAYFTHGGEGQ